MPSQTIATGLTGRKFQSVLRVALKKSNPKVIGIAVAYVSAAGFQHMRTLASEFEIERLRLVTDTRDAVTHPTALSGAMKVGWETRVVSNLEGTFHPKLYVGGSAFDEDRGIADLSLVLISSANLSAAALKRNGECSHLQIGEAAGKSGGQAWKECWDAGAPLTSARLSEYEKYFAERNKHRRPEDLLALGVAEKPVEKIDGKPPKEVLPPPAADQAIENTAATTAWAGLQSFTGDYDLQVEFPRDAGTVLARLLKRAAKEDRASVLCEDGETRQLIFRFYENNGMWRLNVPNATPGVTWAREQKDGIAVVEVDEDDLVTFCIIKPGRRMQETVDRSLALGTWGRTPTRLYGWY